MQLTYRGAFRQLRLTLYLQWRAQGCTMHAAYANAAAYALATYAHTAAR